MNGGVIAIAIKKMEWWCNKARFVRRRIVCSYCNVNFVGYSARSRLILRDRKLISRIRKIFSRFSKVRCYCYCYTVSIVFVVFAGVGGGRLSH